MNGRHSSVWDSTVQSGHNHPASHPALFRTIQKHPLSTAAIRALKKATADTPSRPGHNFTAAIFTFQSGHATRNFYCSHQSRSREKRAGGGKGEKKKRQPAGARAPRASSFRTGEKKKKQILGFLWSPPPPPLQTLAPGPHLAVAVAPPMAKSRPPKRILESYTIKGSDKVIKRETPPLAPPSSFSSAQLIRDFQGFWYEFFLWIVGSLGFCPRLLVSGSWGFGRFKFGADLCRHGMAALIGSFRFLCFPFLRFEAGWCFEQFFILLPWMKFLC